MRALAGRDRELAELDAALARAAAGHGLLARLAGEPGVGKTRLADAVYERARAAGMRAGWARSAEGAAPFGVIFEAMQGAGLDAPALASAHPSRDAAFEALRAALVALGPALLVVDDVHGADRDSLDLLAWLAPRLRAAPTLLLLTERSVATGADRETAARLAGLARLATTWELGGLDADAVAALIGAATGRAVDPLVAEAVQRGTRGNALFVDGVVRAAVRDGTLASGTIRFPRDVQHAIAARVDAAGEEVARALRVAALVPRPFTLGLLAEVLAVEPDALLDALDRAVDEGLVLPTADARFAFRHPLVAECLASALPPRDRARLHAAIAEAAERAAAPPAEVAHHRVLAAPAVGPDAAVAACERAALAATSLHAHEEAARFCRLAVELLAAHRPADERARLAAAHRLGRALLRAGRRGDARAALADAAALARAVDDADTLGEVALAFAETAEFGRVDPEKESLLRAALALRARRDDALRVRLLAGLGAELWTADATRAEGAALAAEALSVARTLGDDALLQAALDARFQSLWGPAHVAERVALADELTAVAARLGGLDAALSAGRRAMLLAAESGDVDRYARELDRLDALARPLAQPGLDETVAQRHLWLALVRGDLDRADALVTELHALGLRVQNPQVEMGARFGRAEVAWWRGDLDALRGLVPGFAADADRMSNLGFIRGRCAQLAARVGDPAARQHLDRFLAAERAATAGSLVTLAGLAFAADAAARLADADAARELLPRLRPHRPLVASIGASICVGAVAHFIGLLEHTAGDRDAAVDALAEGLARHRAMRAPLFAAASAEALDAARGGAPASAPAATLAASLAREGDGWSLTWDGASVRLRGARGVELLAALLARPRVSVHVLDLVGSGELRGADGGDDAALDARALAAYRGRLAALRDDEDEARARGDGAAAARARGEREAIEDELRRSVGRGGRARASGAGERARVAVAKAIRRAVDAVRAVAPGAAAHLERSVKTGFECAYDPDPATPVTWEVAP